MSSIGCAVSMCEFRNLSAYSRIHPGGLCFLPVMDWLVFPQNNYDEVPTFNGTKSGDRTFKEVINIKLDHKSRFLKSL